jgi:UDP-glucose 4-epimerase
MRGEPMTVFGDGRQTRAFSYIDDVAPVIAESIARPGCYNHVFNVGADRAYTVIDLAYAVAKAMGARPNIRHLEARNEVVHAYASHQKVQAQFGDLIKNVALETGLMRMAAWAKQTGPRQSKPFSGIEVRKHLPRSWAALEQRPP